MAIQNRLDLEGVLRGLWLIFLAPIVCPQRFLLGRRRSLVAEVGLDAVHAEIAHRDRGGQIFAGTDTVQRIQCADVTEPGLLAVAAGWIVPRRDDSRGCNAPVPSCAGGGSGRLQLRPEGFHLRLEQFLFASFLLEFLFETCGLGGEGELELLAAALPDVEVDLQPGDLALQVFVGVLQNRVRPRQASSCGWADIEHI